MGGWARAEQGSWWGQGHHRVGQGKGHGESGPGAPSQQLPTPRPDPSPRPQATQALRPQGHSLGPGLAGLVIARGEVSWWAWGTVCNRVSRLCPSASPGMPRGSLPRFSKSPSPPACHPWVLTWKTPTPILGVICWGRGIQLRLGWGLWEEQ